MCRNKYRRYTGRIQPRPETKPVRPYRIVTHGSLRHVVERHVSTRWGGFCSYEPVAWCTSRKLAQQIYRRLMTKFIEETLA